MPFHLTVRDNKHLRNLNPDLARVMRKAAAIWPYKNQIFFVTCSLRTLEEQRKLVAAGASKTLRSRHLPGKKTSLAHAVDIAIKLDGAVRWDWPLFVQAAKVIKAAAKAEGVTIEWGGDWESFRDGPHFQLPWAKYPG